MIICLKHDQEGDRNMKLSLYMHETMADLKINFNKSEIPMINDRENQGPFYADIFNCQVCFLPKYLGVSTSPSRFNIIDWLPLEEKNVKRLDVWKGVTMSIASKSTMISVSLNNSPIYHMFIYLSPKTVIKRLDKVRRTFFWKGEV